MEFNIGDNDSGKYEVEAIWDSAVYTRESESGHLLGLYYLIAWKRYPEEINTWEPASAFQHLRKLINLSHKDYPDKLVVTSPAINTVPPIARPTVKPTELTKQKQRWSTISTNKRAKKNRAAFDFYHVFEQIWITSILDILSCIARD